MFTRLVFGHQDGTGKDAIFDGLLELFLKGGGHDDRYVTRYKMM